MGYNFCELLEPEEDVVVACCSKCKGEIYGGEEFVTDSERVLCPECVEAEFAALPLWAKAQLMGCEVRGGAVCRR